MANALIGKTDKTGAPIASGVDNENSSGVAVDETNGDVYVDNVTSVAAFASDGSAIQRFGSGNLTGGGPLAVDAATGQVFVAEEGGKVAVFGPEEAGAPPSIDGIFAQDLSPTSTRLTAQIDPKGSDTHYFFQYGTSNCAATPSPCTDVPAAPGTDLGSGFGDQTVEVTLEGLTSDATYFFRVVATNEHGTAESPQSAQTFFTTLPTAEGVLANDREWELVSPPDKAGALESITRYGGAIQASQDGNAISYVATAPVGETHGTRSLVFDQLFSTRAGSGWTTQDVATPHNKGEGFLPSHVPGTGCSRAISR